MARQLTFALAVMTLGSVLCVPATVAAEQKPVQGLWLATTSPQSINESVLGRLALRDGMLVFHGARGEFATPLADIKRVATVKGADNVFEIETVDGERLQLSILSAQMLTESPKKAIQLIQRAVREAPPVQRPALVASAAGGGTVR